VQTDGHETLVLRGQHDEFRVTLRVAVSLAAGTPLMPTHTRLHGAIRRVLIVGGFAAFAISPAYAQSATSSATDGAGGAASPTQLDAVVVTGRSGTVVRTKAETSYSVTNIEEENLRMQAPTSVTEAMKSVPGFWVEASGGEASGNIRARGIPVDGFGSVNLLEDGTPVVHDPALGYLNGDQAFRLDETIERIEVVRGGPSSVFYSNAPAGAINFIPRQVGDEASGVFKYTIGDYGLHRMDVYYGTPIGDDWKLGIGGFYRVDDGIRDPGFHANDGGQIRLNLAREFEGGRIGFDFKHLDDKVALYLGIPMRTYEDGKIRGVPGFDAHYGTVAGPETRHLRLTQGDGSLYDFDNSEGTHVERDQFTTKLDLELGGGWQLAESMRISKTDTTRNGVFANSLSSASAFFNQSSQRALLAATPGASALQLRYVNTPGAVFDTANQNGNGLMIVGGLRGLTIPVTEFTSDTRLMRQFQFGDQSHDLTFGYYYATLQEDYDRYSSSVLLDAKDNASLLDLVAVDAAGNVLRTFSENGIWRHGYEWDHASGESTTHAVYLADEWQINERLRIDGGVRWEQVETSGWAEIRQTVNLGTLATSNILTGSGEYIHHDEKSSKTGWTVGANWQFDDHSGVFARWTSAFRLPSLGSYLTRGSNCTTSTPELLAACIASNTGPAITQTMDLGEVGYKFANPLFSVYATTFYTKYDNVGFSNYVFDPNGGVSYQQQGYASTRTYGLELEGGWYPVDWFDLQLTATLQDPEYQDLAYRENSADGPVLRNYVGNQLIRVPKTSYRLVPGFNLFNDRLRVQLSYERQGERYVDTANSVRLPSYDVVGASMRFDATPQWSFYLYGDNLANSLGLTEGNPRAGELQSDDAGANSFIARPVLGRSYRLAAMYRF
jgi:outer membrane receptor protein involved in Fe transport